MPLYLVSLVDNPMKLAVLQMMELRLKSVNELFQKALGHK